MKTRVRFQMTRAEIYWLNELAKERGLSVSDYLEQRMKEYIKNDKQTRLGQLPKEEIKRGLDEWIETEKKSTLQRTT